MADENEELNVVAMQKLKRKVGAYTEDLSLFDQLTWVAAVASNKKDELIQRKRERKELREIVKDDDHRKVANEKDDNVDDDDDESTPGHRQEFPKVTRGKIPFVYLGSLLGSYDVPNSFAFKCCRYCGTQIREHSGSRENDAENNNSILKIRKGMMMTFITKKESNDLDNDEDDNGDLGNRNHEHTVTIVCGSDWIAKEDVDEKSIPSQRQEFPEEPRRNKSSASKKIGKPQGSNEDEPKDKSSKSESKKSKKNKGKGPKKPRKKRIKTPQQTTITHPNLPANFKTRISSMGGDSNEARLILQKNLYKTDVDKQQNRLSLPINSLRCNFLSEEEAKKLENEKSMIITIIDPMMEAEPVHLAKWKYKENSSSYVLITKWNKIAKKNNLKHCDLIQVWSFRDRENGLHLAIVRRDVNNGVVGGEGSDNNDGAADGEGSNGDQAMMILQQ